MLNSFDHSLVDWNLCHYQLVPLQIHIEHLRRLAELVLLDLQLLLYLLEILNLLYLGEIVLLFEAKRNELEDIISLHFMAVS